MGHPPNIQFALMSAPSAQHTVFYRFLQSSKCLLLFSTFFLKWSTIPSYPLIEVFGFVCVIITKKFVFTKSRFDSVAAV